MRLVSMVLLPTMYLGRKNRSTVNETDLRAIQGELLQACERQRPGKLAGTRGLGGSDIGRESLTVDGTYRLVRGVASPDASEVGDHGNWFGDHGNWYGLCSFVGPDGANDEASG